MEQVRSKILALLAGHEQWRRRTINLIASENMLSPAVRAVLTSDLVQRYGDYTGRDLSARHYRGNRYVEQIERETVRIAQETFRAQFIELRPISGHVAGAAVLMGLCQPGDLVMEPGRDAGGHRESSKFKTNSLIHLDVQYLPFEAQRYNIDLDETIQRIRQYKPKVVILGSSNFLFPHPVATIAELMKKELPESVLVFDGSHVMGFLACRHFQDPLAEGADLVFGSTHKTFPGPQGGIIFSNRDDLMEKISQATYPALVTNHHLFRLPALALAMLEMQNWGGAYMDQVVANAQVLGGELEANGIPCVCVDGSYTRSHTLLARVGQYAKSDQASARLEDAGIITNGAFLPELWGTDGIRLGVQEITRLGARPQDMQLIARWISKAVIGNRPAQEIAREVYGWAAELGPVQYTWAD